MTPRASAGSRSAAHFRLLAALLLAAAPVVGSERVGLRSEAAAVYTHALGTLAAGSVELALDQHLAAEVTIAPGETDEQIERLQVGQMAVVRRLGNASIESLVPLVVLHEDAYLRHLEAGRLRLAVRSRRFAVDLAELYVGQSPRPDADPLGSALLTSLGGYLQQSTMDTAATALYGRALELDGHNGTARLGLASLLERQGRYAESVPQLEMLIRQGDRHGAALRREARLRLGVNQLRLGRVDAGREALETLRAAPERDWILSLAYQELARQAAAQGDHAAARTLLTEAVDRLPGDASLAVQLAYAADREGGRGVVADLRRMLAEDSTAVGPSPRARYASVSGAPLDELRQENDDAALARLQPLEDALKRLEGKRGGAR